MDTGLQEYIKQNYGIDLDEATTMSELDIVTTLNLRDCYISHLDLSKFRNVKILDISYNPIKEIKWGDTSKIEEFSWWGVRMDELDFNLEKFPSLKIVRPGQDNLTALDFSNNPQIEEILFSTSHSLKNLILPQDCKLKRIDMQGVLIPFVDLTACNNLEYVNISYWNTFKGKDDVYGDGYPRPFIFVNNQFSSDVIDSNAREYEYYCYKLITVNEASDDLGRMILDKFNGGYVQYLISQIRPSHFGEGIAKLHYILRQYISEIKNSDLN